MIEFIYDIYIQSKGISIDSRTIEKQMLFFALKGNNVDGNLFADNAVKKGGIAIIDDPQYKKNDNYILVNDVFETLTELARFHRKKLKANVLAITGTNGKTTTKELVYNVLSTHYKVHATKGNLNNHIGVPITILQTPFDTEWLIVEMGANHKGEIEYLCNIAQPNYAIITNIGIAHLEGFGNLENIFLTKAELYDYIKIYGKQIFVNADDQKLFASAKDYTNYTYSVQNGNVVGKIIDNESPMQIQWQHNNNIFLTKSHLFGSYNLYNILAAIAIGTCTGVPYDKINSAIEAYIPKNNRSQTIKTNKNNIIILDAYNANPSSMKLAINDFLQLKDANKLLILGSMLELGKYSEEKHIEIIKLLTEQDVKHCIFVGTEFYKLKSKYNHSGYTFYQNIVETIKHIEKNIIKNTTILVKGSRGIALEKTITYL